MLCVFYIDMYFERNFVWINCFFILDKLIKNLIYGLIIIFNVLLWINSFFLKFEDNYYDMLICIFVLFKLVNVFVFLNFFFCGECICKIGVYFFIIKVNIFVRWWVFMNLLISCFKCCIYLLWCSKCL